MLNPTLFNLIFIRISVFVLQAIAPCCLLLSLWTLRTYYIEWSAGQWPHVTLLQLYFFAEAAFLVFLLWYRVKLQVSASHPPLKDEKARRQLFTKVQGEIHEPEQFLKGWFRGADLEDIGRDNLKDFLNWAFWEGRATEDDEQEMDEYVDGIEDLAGRKFKKHGSAKCIRLTLDPIDIDYRSLTWYLMIMLVDTAGTVELWIHGFKYCRTPFNNVFPPSPAILVAKEVAPVPNLSYWYRPHTSQKRLPVLFLHGVGIGLQPYVQFLRILDESLNGKQNGKQNDQSDGEVGIMAVETLSISSRLTNPILSRPNLVKELTTILDTHNFKEFVLVVHSYGSVLSSHILTDDDLAARVSAVLLVDPVSILLHTPTVAYNFTVRKPVHANEWQLWYFASRDPGIAHTLGRHLFWFESVLWHDRILELVNNGMRMTVSLSKRDLIVDTAAVARYLHKDDRPQTGQKAETLEEEEDRWKSRKWQGHGLDILWWEDFDHAQVMDGKESRLRLIEILCAYSNTK